MLPRDLIAKVRKIEIRTRKLVEDLTGGAYHSVFKGRGIEFSEVREYTPEDDVRDIDWNVTARMGVPYIKKYAEERELTVILAIDASASLFFGSGEETKREKVAETAALLAFSAIRNHDKVGLRTCAASDPRTARLRTGIAENPHRKRHGFPHPESQETRCRLPLQRFHRQLVL